MKPLRRLGILSIVVAMSQPLAAQSTWNGTTNANWSTATNWSPGIPAGGANITLADTTANGLTLDDGNRSVGSITVGTTGTRTSGFTLNTTTANTLTITGGVIANGNFTTGIGARIRGKTVISAEQTWQVGGQAGTHAADRGIALNEVASSNTQGSVTLNANLNKYGTGQLTMGAVNVTGAGDVNVNDGSLKLNAGGSLPLTVGGTGKIVVNNTAMLILSQNSGSFAVTRPIQFNLGASLMTGSGTNTKTGDFTIASDMEWNGAHTITNNNDNNNAGDPRFIFTGVMSGTGTITKAGPRSLTLSGTSSNTIATGITVAEGELRLNKTGATAVPGNILITGGSLRKLQPNQIADSSSITVTGGAINFNEATPDTIASLTISSAATSSVSGFTVTGTTSLTAGLHQLNSGESFATHSLALSNNAAIQLVGAATAPASSTVNIGAGGLTMNTGRLLYGNPGNASTTQVNLAGDVVSTGTSVFSAANYLGERILDLQAGSRSFAVNDGMLDIQTTVRNGTLVKSGAGTLILSRTGSTADFSFTDGPVKITTQATAGNVSLSGGTVLMDVGGTNPAKITTTGNFTSTGGSIDLSVANGPITPGSLELVRYTGTLVGTPVINITPQLLASRMNPVVDLGSGTDSAITVTSTALPLSLVWHGASGGIWDNTVTANFNTGAEMFYPLDSVSFDDTGVNPAVQLDSVVFPTDLVFDHGLMISTYTLAGSGSISGPTKLTKNGTGTTVLATDNAYTGATDILGGTLRVGNAGLTGGLGTGAVSVMDTATLDFNRDGYAVVGNLISGVGTVVNSGPGTVALTANSTGFTGAVSVTAGTLQLGDGGTTGSLGAGGIDIAAGANLAIKRSDVPTIANWFSGAGSVTVVGGSPILTSSNAHTGGLSVRDGGVVRVTGDMVFGALSEAPIANAIRLEYGGIKNQDSDPVIDVYRGIAITVEAYFTAGWSKTLTINGPVTGTGNVFVNYDSGRVILANAASDWNGVLTLGASKPGFSGTTAGTLEIGMISNGGMAGPLGTASADPANLVFNVGRLIYNGADASTDRGFTLQGAGTIEVPANTLTMSGVATGPGALTKAGAGTLVLTGSNDFAGEKVVAGGTLVVKSATALGGTGAFIRFTGTTGVLDLATDESVAPYPLTIGVNNSGTILSNVATPGTPGINHTLGNFELSRITLNVAAGANVSGGDPRVTITSLSCSSGDSGTTLLAPTTANLTVGSAAIASGNAAKTLTLGGTSLSNYLTGPVTDGINTLSVNKGNDSVWTLSGDNTFSGNVTVDDGVLIVTHSNALGAATKTLVIAGDAGNNRIPELQLAGGISPTLANMQISGAGVANLTGALRNVSGDNTLTVSTQVTMRTGNGNTTLYSDSGTLTLNTPLVTANATNRALTLAGPGNGVINGVIANGSTANLPVTKSGTGTWTINGAQTYSGATTVNGGTLSLGQAALNDSAAVVIASGATLHLNFAGSDRVGSLTIDGTVKPDGLYDSTTDPGFITGTGSIRVGPEPSGYGTWASAQPFTAGVNDGPADDPDGDDIPNLLEFVLGGVPVGTGASDTSILPKQTLTASDLVLTFKRSDSSETDVTLKVQWSDDLSTWHDFVTVGAADALPQVDVTEDVPTAELDTVSVSIPRTLAPGGRIFARLQAVK
ncbi:MAG: autotransporter-associated beta strand repeat-containing protein [Verrucomicrobia bacterium]|nr:autotransporter-associated beta strand repeat-containing protein [Verrucomicrobiota bacterium]